MDNIKKEIDKLIDLIEESISYQEYIKILKRVEKNKRINNIVKEIKELQQQAVKLEYYKKNDELNKIDLLIKEKRNQLNTIPLYCSYIDKAEEINDSIKLIKNKIQDYMSNI